VAPIGQALKVTHVSVSGGGTVTASVPWTTNIATAVRTSPGSFWRAWASTTRSVPASGANTPEGVRWWATMAVATWSEHPLVTSAEAKAAPALVDTVDSGSSV
jgi:hypothetical protein